jgi:hypothetical protein
MAALDRLKHSLRPTVLVDLPILPLTFLLSHLFVNRPWGVKDMKTRILISVSLIVVVLALANLFVSHAQQAVGVSASPPAGNGARHYRTR